MNSGNLGLNIVSKANAKQNKQFNFDKYLIAAGFKEIIDNLDQPRSLELNQIEFLLTKATISQLLTLLNRTNKIKTKKVKLIPVYFFSYELDHRSDDYDNATTLLISKLGSKLPKGSIIYFDVKNPFDIDENLKSQLKKLRRIYPGVLFYAPSIVNIHKWLMFEGQPRIEDNQTLLTLKTLNDFKSFGFDGFGVNNNSKFLAILDQIQCKGLHCTCLEMFPNVGLLSRELLYLSKEAIYTQTLNLDKKSATFQLEQQKFKSFIQREWGVGILNKNGAKIAQVLNIKDVSLQFRIIKTFLIGALILPRNWTVSLYSRFLSFETIKHLVSYGVIDQIYLAGNKESAQIFGLPEYQFIKEHL